MALPRPKLLAPTTIPPSSVQRWVKRYREHEKISSLGKAEQVEVDRRVSKPFVSCNSLLNSLLERRTDAFIVHLTPNHYLLYGLAANPGSVRPTAPGHGRSLGPVPSTHLQKPSWEDASPSHPEKARPLARRASHPGPSGSRAESQMGRALW